MLPDLHQFSETLAWTLLHFIWQGFLVGVLYAAARRLSASVKWQHFVALTGLLVLMAAPMITFYWLAADASAVSTVATIAAATPDLAHGAAATSAFSVQGAAEDSFWTLALVAVWLLGAMIISARLFSDWRFVRAAIRQSSPPSRELLAIFEQQMKRIGVWRRVRLRLTARITTPAVYGFLRPVVLLPTALALSIPRDQLETLLIHELAHIRRADFLANVLALFARTLLYFHPVVHWICRDLEHTRETLCDDLVVDLDVDRLKYARALSTAEQFRRQVPMPLLTATGGELTQRVHRILAVDPAAKRDTDRAPLLLALAAIVTSIVGLNGMTQEQLLAVARPEFRAAYSALMTTAMPPLAATSSMTTTPQRVTPTLSRPTSDVVAPAAASTLAETPLAADLAEPSAGSGVFSEADPVASEAPGPMIEGLAQRPAAPTPVADIVPAAAAMPEAIAASSTVPPALAPATPTIASPPRVVRQVQPDYPRSARWQGVEGSVTLTYSVGDDGAPVGVAVKSADPSGVFEQSTLEAFARWRFDQPAGSGVHTQTFDFNLGTNGADGCKVRLGSKICRRSGRGA